ncbi:MAG: RNB domain-containing ribonuclease, partial [Bilophila sp.]
MSKVQHPVRLDDLVRFLDLSRRDKRALEELLDALVAQGRVLRLRGGKWVTAAQANVITGVLSIQRSGVGFVTPDTLLVPDADPDTPADPDAPAKTALLQRPRQGRRKDSAMVPDIFIHQNGLGDAWHGDRVEVVTQTPEERGHRAGHGAYRSQGRSPEGRIVRVLERRQKELAVHVTHRTTARGVLCRPADPRLDFLLDVVVSGLPEKPKRGELLLVTPADKLEDGLWAGVARVSLGLEDDARVQERLVKLNHEIPLEFPPNVLAEAAQLEELTEDQADLDGVTASDAFPPPLAALSTVSTAKRQDLRALPFVTIDGADARDFDDAVFVTPVTGASDSVRWELWVAIADVSHFVRPDHKPGAALDREARERGNSYYFPLS